MFFVLSKILYFLLFPFWWIVLVLLWAWFNRNRITRKRLLKTALLLLIVFTHPFLYRSVLLSWYTTPSALPVGKTYEAGILLGGMAGYDKYQHGYFGDNSDRFIQAANLYHQGIIKRIIVSGGTGSLGQSEPPEAFFLREQLIANGVKPADIFIETRSRNTHENAVLSKRITDSLHLQPPFILVTSAMHMRRSESVFRKAGFSCIGFPCDYKVTKQNFSLDDTVIPNISLLNRWGDLIKEMVGLVVYRFTGKA